MFELQIPSDLTECTVEDLASYIEEAKQEFDLLNESDDLSDPILDRMTELADGIEAIYTHLYLSKKDEVAERIKKVLHE